MIIVNIIPSSNSPLVVSNAIEDVKILVSPRKFPPTIKATPNSDIALLKLEITDKRTPLTDSLSTAIDACVSEAPKVLAKSAIFGSTVSIVLVTKLTVIGVIRTDWPIIIAKGVYNK